MSKGSIGVTKRLDVPDRIKYQVAFSIYTAGSLLLLGTVTFKYLEGWSWVNALYYTTSAMTTVGFGDFVPTSDLSKLVTVFFSLAGIGVLFYALGQISAAFFHHHEERHQVHLKQIARMHNKKKK